MKLPNGGSWLRLKADYETGMFTVPDLAHMYGVSKSTIKFRAAKFGWVKAVGPEVTKALPGLTAVAHGGLKDEETIEALVAVAEGRPPDPDVLTKEKAGSVAMRKAGVLRDHRELISKYRRLFLSGAETLEEYSQGRMKVSFVRGQNAKGEEIVLAFSLFSRQSGFIDAVDKLGGVLERVLKLERQSHGLEDVDGDGNPLKSKREDGANPFASLRGKTTEELEADLSSLFQDLRQTQRLTPVPPGLVADA